MCASPAPRCFPCLLRGFLPGLNFVDAARLLQQTHNILYSSYDACTLPDPEHPDATFVADAMVANPVVYGEAWSGAGLSFDS